MRDVWHNARANDIMFFPKTPSSCNLFLSNLRVPLAKGRYNRLTVYPFVTKSCRAATISR
ncbi:hypothetical protein BU24DRAFT_45626 [Aaosphaeria arxii CBS 175.79]|uniref:Uncharacterized protein n=1 Tax=Aaosphaeria arxii CBS 175.79 TaxID=1450172 RepID=A0A6A5XCR5_9PLEO|nr:uncharacterized protein BU24DRAFT_45626 [Aaosphaeria arxii CBS 175.79]KAF2010768.1 hypothetical protein BU24DRAFT_45626 [Aaosphaeria arxii CBS 175.79]